MRIKIGSFNCLNFGHPSKKDLHTISKIIKDEKFDVIALQEIKSPKALAELINELNWHCAKGPWKGVCDDAVCNHDYAFIWNSKRLSPAQTKLPNGEIRVFKPHIYKQYKVDREIGQLPLARDPFYARFHTTIPGLPKIELRLLNTHIRFSKGKDGKENPLNIGEIALRRYEFGILSKCIYAKLADKVYGNSEGYGNPGTAYTIILGDYNMNLSSSEASSTQMREMESIIIDPKTNSARVKKIITVQNELTTLKKTTDSEEDTGIFSNNYDHFSFDEERFSGTKYQEERVDPVSAYYDNDSETYQKKVSDHVPIKLTLDIKKR